MEERKSDLLGTRRVARRVEREILRCMSVEQCYDIIFVDVNVFPRKTNISSNHLTRINWWVKHSYLQFICVPMSVTPFSHYNDNLTGVVVGW